ncbi:metallophosphoesterase family protein [Crossiella cryophila]|uniref:3',5'-cyclic AMP phosphodiesterase CpdA n=1 Tax=Crossiella cryophila TaxID=43355 RepID=A0A7W7C9M8_9PSEU|nr:metallophosphoesterase [Crossiella cryophila]MBB4677097.1 3',5'-cyclic AMP phosphodiesterase CpdA [Crossiella cryophila]
MAPPEPRLLAVSDLHVAYPENRTIVEEQLHPGHPGDWLIVAGDVGELYADIEWALTLLAQRFDTVIWVPGNHELWTPKEDPVQLRGDQRYRRLVEMCRELGVYTPEDPFPVWRGAGGPVAIAPLFVLYDYTFRTDPADDKAAALAKAHAAGVVCTDEFLLHPNPYPSRDAWCRSRLTITQRRLDAHDSSLPLVLVNHWPLVRDPTFVLRYPEFALWCGTEGTADWHRRYRVSAAVYGHLHIPRTTTYDGVRFEEVSIGYPRERKMYGGLPRGPLRQILPVEENP